MDNPLTALVMLTTTTGGWFSGLSDTKKGVFAFLAAIALGFAMGTTTVSQIGLPQRVSALEVAVDVLEEEHTNAREERSYILAAIRWQNCAIEAQNDGDNLRAVCGGRPVYTFGRE